MMSVHDLEGRIPFGVMDTAGALLETNPSLNMGKPGLSLRCLDVTPFGHGCHIPDGVDPGLAAQAVQGHFIASCGHGRRGADKANWSP